jgi:predicted PurR-regulated permease PerM
LQVVRWATIWRHVSSPSAQHEIPTVRAIVYQQFENYVVQPRIQSRAVQLDPFIVVIAAIFGGTLLGIVGALLAIPSAAAIQIAVREYMEYRRAYPAAGN